MKQSVYAVAFAAMLVSGVAVAQQQQNAITWGLNSEVELWIPTRRPSGPRNS